MQLLDSKRAMAGVPCEVILLLVPVYAMAYAPKGRQGREKKGALLHSRIKAGD